MKNENENLVNGVGDEGDDEAGDECGCMVKDWYHTVWEGSRQTAGWTKVH